MAERETGRVLWAQPLSNAVAPVEALVSDTGRYVVTFDNWHSLGYGPNVVVIYGAEGQLLRSFSLEDLLSEAELRLVFRTVSSRWWPGESGLEPRPGGDRAAGVQLEGRPLTVPDLNRAQGQLWELRSTPPATRDLVRTVKLWTGQVLEGQRLRQLTLEEYRSL